MTWPLNTTPLPVNHLGIGEWSMLTTAEDIWDWLTCMIERDLPYHAMLHWCQGLSLALNS
jgi:hypothetical protein